MLRQCLQWLDSPQAQANATVFVAKFFGRAGLMSFISAVPQSQRPALFQSLLFEAVGRAVNPVGGAVGLLWTGNWHVCQSAVETVLRGGVLQPLPEFYGAGPIPDGDDCSESGIEVFRPVKADSRSVKRKRWDDDVAKFGSKDVLLSLGPESPEYRRAVSPSEESETTTLGSGSSTNCSVVRGSERPLLRLFV